MLDLSLTERSPFPKNQAVDTMSSVDSPVVPPPLPLPVWSGHAAIPPPTDEEALPSSDWQPQAGYFLPPTHVNTPDPLRAQTPWLSTPAPWQSAPPTFTAPDPYITDATTTATSGPDSPLVHAAVASPVPQTVGNAHELLPIQGLSGGTAFTPLVASRPSSTPVIVESKGEDITDNSEAALPASANLGDPVSDPLSTLDAPGSSSPVPPRATDMTDVMSDIEHSLSHPTVVNLQGDVSSGL